MTASAASLALVPRGEAGLGLGAALLLAGLVGFALAEVGARPLTVELYGELEHVDPRGVQALVEPYLRAGFFSLDPDLLELRLAELPWVRSADVERLWPDRIAVRIKAHEPLARWGDAAVLTRAGVLVASAYPPVPGVEVVRIDAGPADAARVARDLPRVQTILRRAEAGLRGWELSPAGDLRLSLELDGFSVVAELGREDLADRVQRLAEVALPVLRPRIRTVTHIDLRYRNGFAVGWQRPEKETNP